MEHSERNRTLLPFAAGAAVCSVVFCLCAGYRGWALSGMLIACFCAAFVGLLLLYVLFLVIAALFADKTELQRTASPFYSAVLTYTEGMVSALFRIRIHVSGAGLLPEGRWLLVCNHRSSFDPLITGWVLRARQIAFIAKSSLGRLPMVGAFMHKSCCLFIDREDDRAALKTILEAIRLIKEDVTSIAIYPEGTRSTTGELLPFRNGAFKIAQKAKVPIVVAAVRGTERIMKNFPWRPTDVYLEFRAVIDAGTVARLNTSEIGEEVRKCITCAIC